MDTDKQKDDSATVASAELQPVSVRALAIPEILERVLQHAKCADLVRYRTVARLWLATAEATVLRFNVYPGKIWVEDRWGATVWLPGRVRSRMRYDVSETLMRDPALGRRFTTVYLLGWQDLPDRLISALRSCTELRELDAPEGPAILAQIAVAHKVRPFGFHHLHTMKTTRGRRPWSAADALQFGDFLRSCPSMQSVDLRWHPVCTGPSASMAAVVAELAGILQALAPIHRLTLSISNYLAMPEIGADLLGNLRTLTIACDANAASQLARQLRDTAVLSQLRRLPKFTRDRPHSDQAAGLLESWPDRIGPVDIQGDLQILQYWVAIDNDGNGWSL